MYPNTQQFYTSNTKLFWCEIVTYNYDGFADDSELELEDDVLFFEKKKEKLQKVHPNLTEEETEKIINLQERMADTIFDIWLTKRNKKTA